MTTTTPTRPADIVDRLLADRPSFHLGGNARWDSLPETLTAISQAVRSADVTPLRSADVTLETGTGASTIVFAASGAHHTAISPDPAEHELIRAYCADIGIDDSRLTFIVGASEDVLPSLLSAERTLDVAYIDGAHCFPFPHVDWCYITRALKLGGTLLMDDISIPGIAPIFRHMSLEDNWRLERTLDDRAAEFTLIEEPPPGDEWLEQRLNTHYPDVSFVAPPRQLQLKLAYHVPEMGRRLAQRNPALRRAYHRVRSLRG